MALLIHPLHSTSLIPHTTLMHLQMDKPDWKQTQSVNENSGCLCACGGVCVYALPLTVLWKMGIIKW